MDVSTSGPTDLAVLPDAVQARAAVLAADALGEMPASTVPVPLRRVAVFAPARRAKLAGLQVLTAAATDPEFRERLAVQIRAAYPDQLKMLERMLTAEETMVTVVAAVPPVEAAALFWLVRPPGWEDGLRRAVDALGLQERVQVVTRAESEAQRLRERVDESADELRAVREESRARIDQLKQENAELRRKLGETRARVRAAEEAVAAHRHDAEVVRAEAAKAAQDGSAEIRRLRTRVEELEREVAASKQVDRSERNAQTERARLLLDSLLESAQGLRRELALPTAAATPGQRVEAQLVADSAPTGRTPGVGAVESVPELAGLLGLPRVRLIIDGYNVSKTAWPVQPLAAQRELLVNGVAAATAQYGAETTVVFDAADSAVRPTVRPPRGVRVLFSPAGVIADDIIRELVAVEPAGRTVLVVTSDQELAGDVRRAGARVVDSSALVGLLGRA